MNTTFIYLMTMISMGQCKKDVTPLLTLWSYVFRLLDEDDIDVLVQERRNSIANALELRLSCTNPSIWSHKCLSNLWHMLVLCIYFPSWSLSLTTSDLRYYGS